jgi:menaquinone-dependent protoporphyrinogen oxidase
MNILIVYASQEGQTAKIAHEMAGALRADGCSVKAVRVQDAPSPEAFDAVIAGAPIHMGRHDKAATEWVIAHRAALEKTHGAFFSVSMAAASKDDGERAEAKRLANEFLTETGWRPELVACFAGALAYSRYGLVKRLIMQRIASKEGGETDPSHDYEYTDWDSVIAFARDVSGSVTDARA